MVEHRAGLGAIAVALLAITAGWLLWSRFGERAGAGRAATLLPEDVELRGVGGWITSDLRAAALRDASLDGGLPLGDAELVRRLKRAFESQPWVREVVRVTLRHPAGAVVEVRCREPVAMVRVPGGLLAVDAEGVLLPTEDFNPESAERYPKVGGVTSGPRGVVGSAWGDPFVEEAAALAAVVGPEWRPLGLVECRPSPAGGWELVGAEGLLIRFGSAPGRERPGEPTAAMKAARLRSLAAGRPTGTIDLSEPPPAEPPASPIPTPAL